MQKGGRKVGVEKEKETSKNPTESKQSHSEFLIMIIFALFGERTKRKLKIDETMEHGTKHPISQFLDIPKHTKVMEQYTDFNNFLA